MPGLLRKLFGKPSKKTAAPVKQEYRPPVPHTDKERSADQNYRKRIMDQVTQLTKNAESAGGALDKEKLDDARGQFENMQRMARGMNLQGDAEYQALEQEFLSKADGAQDAIDHKARKDAKVKEQKENILKQKGTPLETLIKKVKTLNGGANADADYLTGHADPATSTESTDYEADKKDRLSIAKEKLGKAFSLTAFKEFLKERLKDWHGTISAIVETAATSSGIAGDKKDYGEAAETAEKFIKRGNNKTKLNKEDSVDANGIVGNVLSLISGVLHVISLVKAGANWIKAANATEGSQLDAQQRWKNIKGIFHKLVDVFGDINGTLSVFTALVPLLGSCLSLTQGGLAIILNLTDMVDSSVHIEMMRRDRNQIFDRIQKKKAKYENAATKDETAAEAYTLQEERYRSRSGDVNEKRKALLQKVALGNQDGASKIHIVKSDEMRSRNDSRYREAQYGIGERMAVLRNEIAEDRAKEERGEQVQPNKMKENKSKLRQMEALELMEEYRELDKSHKKMRKALYHQLEEIGKGTVGLISSGTKLTGEIACMTVAGAVAGAALLGTASTVGIVNGGYSLARGGAAQVYGIARKLAGTADNKETTRNDMAIMMIDRMSEVGNSDIWTQTRGFKNEPELDTVNPKTIVRQGRNVSQLHNVLRRGLDADMPELINAPSKAELRKKIAASFGQE